MKKKIFSIGIISVCCALAMSSVAFASVPVIGGRLSRGVDAMCYYVDPTANSYISVINTGINRWTGHDYFSDGFISMTAVSSPWATDVDYYAKAANEFLSPGCLAETSFFDSTGSYMSGSLQYYYAEVVINNNTFCNRTEFQQIGTMAHEFGHALGLDENNSDKYKIMCQLGYGRVVNTVSNAECAQVVSIYGGD